MNLFYTRTINFQDKLKSYANNIFKTYGRELVLRLEEYNLLQSKHNCIETSTAIGFILEEFLVSKLEMYTHCSDEEEYIIDRFVGATSSESYDCYSIQSGIKFMVNVKAEKGSSNNTALAAIGQLYRNYCKEDPTLEKSYIILKVKYSIKDAYEDTADRRAKPRHIYIDNLETYCLEEVDLSQGHQQDNRSWSESKGGESHKNNGRLRISNKFRLDHQVPIADISYQNTFQQLSDLVMKNQ